jgi:hypothetical protein
MLGFIITGCMYVICVDAIRLTRCSTAYSIDHFFIRTVNEMLILFNRLLIFSCSMSYYMPKTKHFLRLPRAPHTECDSFTHIKGITQSYNEFLAFPYSFLEITNFLFRQPVSWLQRGQSTVSVTIIEPWIVYITDFKMSLWYNGSLNLPKRKTEYSLKRSFTSTKEKLLVFLTKHFENNCLKWKFSEVRRY